jgi:nucleoside-diphosphate-sugar epimerase
MQTILGSGGAIGVELAKALTSFTDYIRLVSRNPKAINSTDKLFSADLTNTEEVLKAVEDSDVVYLTAGFEYKAKVWKSIWPLVIRNVIDACKTHKSKLVFFDNVYMYDSSFAHNFTEETPVNPQSEKGKVRAEIAKMILDEVSTGNLTALIARSADFYGPNIKKTSILTETVFNNLWNGKKANWLISLNYKHSFTYTPDAGKATALLGNTADAYNQVWHLPTAANPFTGKEWIETIVKPKSQVLPMFLLNILSLFIPLMKELKEMVYQYDRDYIFNSSKFINRFNFTPTPYSDGVKNIIQLEFSTREK